MRIDDLVPWTDRAGRLSLLHAAAFAAVIAPALWIASAFVTGGLGAEPLKAATHLTGTWTLYFLLASLAVTPLKGLLAWSRLVAIRRMLGVAAFAYIAGHLTLYIGDQSWNLAKVASEIASRIYLTIGFAALLGLAVLATTSFDAAMRRLRRNWKRLHRAVYVLTALGLLHFFMQSKSDVSQAVLLSGVFVGLMLHRLAVTPRTPAGMLAVAVLSGIAAAALEFAWYAAASGIPAGRVLLANLDFSYQVRPMWWVMAILALPLPAMLLRPLRGHAGLRKALRLPS
ncbi:ferric reductase-like transmembrane domain-containing protein [Pelagibius sp. 7325]|uniref:sulfite oxidase heme-binding subunit YedZ n=1 Tax=Pelagibius sp. 7325 TaxID=3131994 RepID=UPI0030EE776B